MSKKTKLTVLILLTLVIVSVFLFQRFSDKKESLIAAPRPLTNSSELLPVEVFSVSTRELSNTVYTTGTLISSEETSLFSETSGKVIEIHFIEGEVVEKNTLLIKLNDNDLKAQFNRTELEKTLAVQTLKRQKQLFEKGGISQEQFDAAQNRVQVLDAQLDEIKARIEKTEVRAPFRGIVGLRKISPGAYLNPGTETATIQNIDRLNIEFSVPEKYFKSVQTNDVIKFRVSGSDSLYKAQVYAIEPKIDINTRTVIMRARFDNRQAGLLPGLFAYIEYTIETIQEAILIPSQALVPELKGQKVYVYKSGSVGERQVETGLRTDTEIQITAGLQPGDSVITTGILQIRPGMSVRVRN